MNILIPNVTGPTNIGDQTILIPVIELLKKNFPEAQITLHTTSPELYKRRTADTIKSHLYNWAVFENTNSIERIKRLTELFIAYISLQLGLSLIARGTLKELLEDYIHADIIVFIGGGYFRSKKKLSQSLNLLMISSLFNFAKLTNAIKIVLPLSFGPFAYTWQERYSAKALEGFDLVAARESFSFRALKKNHVPNIILSSDTALLLKVKTKVKNVGGYIIGFTIRSWMDKNRQNIFEGDVIKAVSRFAKGTNSTVQPILQVKGDRYGESDECVTKKIMKALKKNNVKVLKTQTILSVKDFLIYSQIDLLLGMRMHSNILAAVHGTPFVALSYEHKTEGIANDLSMGEYVLKCEDVNAQNLYELLMNAYKKRCELKNTINSSVKKIKHTETARWDSYFQTL